MRIARSGLVCRRGQILRASESHFRTRHLLVRSPHCNTTRVYTEQIISFPRTGCCRHWHSPCWHGFQRSTTHRVSVPQTAASAACNLYDLDTGSRYQSSSADGDHQEHQDLGRCKRFSSIPVLSMPSNHTLRATQSKFSDYSDLDILQMMGRAGSKLPSNFSSPNLPLTYGHQDLNSMTMVWQSLCASKKRKTSTKEWLNLRPSWKVGEHRDIRSITASSDTFMTVCTKASSNTSIAK
jgi:hypothetical protein